MSSNVLQWTLFIITIPRNLILYFLVCSNTLVYNTSIYGIHNKGCLKASLLLCWSPYEHTCMHITAYVSGFNTLSAILLAGPWDLIVCMLYSRKHTVQGNIWTSAWTDILRRTCFFQVKKTSSFYLNSVLLKESMMRWHKQTTTS